MDDQIKDLINNEIKTNEVCLFMKGTPDAPQCGFSMAVTNILKILEVNFKGVNVLADQDLREGIKVFSDWPTIPQLYVKNEFIGGCDIVKEMYENGELAKLLKITVLNLKRKANYFIIDLIFFDKYFLNKFKVDIFSESSRLLSFILNSILSSQ